MAAKRQLLSNCYRILGVSENCNDEVLRLAFVHLAKKFHPDGGTQHADPTRFSEVEDAYRQIQKHRLEEKDKQQNAIDVEEFDIKHKAPQHRHYLMYNVGVGTVCARQRLHSIVRAQRAVDNVMEHRLQKLQAEERNTLIGKDKQRSKDVKTQYGMDRLVEDLIQEAMNRGEFSSLKGMGKPLKENANARNPYVDFVTHKLNQVLIENGFTPEWIQLSKEIREDTSNLRSGLLIARNEIGPIPLTPIDEKTWRKIVKDLKPTVKKINNKIDKYNLLVPLLHKQMVHIKLKNLADEVLLIRPTKAAKQRSKSASPDNLTSDGSNFFTMIKSVLTPKN